MKFLHSYWPTFNLEKLLSEFKEPSKIFIEASNLLIKELFEKDSSSNFLKIHYVFKVFMIRIKTFMTAAKAINFWSSLEKRSNNHLMFYKSWENVLLTLHFPTFTDANTCLRSSRPKHVPQKLFIIWIFSNCQSHLLVFINLFWSMFLENRAIHTLWTKPELYVTCSVTFWCTKSW